MKQKKKEKIKTISKRNRIIKREVKVEKAFANYHIKNSAKNQIGMITIKSSHLKHLIGKKVKVMIYQSKNEL